MPYFLGVSAGLYACWVGVTALAAFIGPVLGDIRHWGFDMAFPAVFLVLLRGMWKGIGPAIPWLVSLLVAAITYLAVPGAWYVPAGALTGHSCRLDRIAAMIDRWTLATIVVMALATYLTRIGGYLLLGNRELSQRTMTLLDTVPGCVLVAVIAPTFVSGRLADLIALGITMVAATRLPLLPTVVIAVGSAALLRSAVG